MNMIKIDNEFYIDSDEYQYYLQQKKINQKTGKEYYSTLAYYSTVEQCVESVMKIKQRRLCKKDSNFIEYINKCGENNAEMRGILSQIGSF